MHKKEREQRMSIGVEGHAPFHIRAQQEGEK